MISEENERLGAPSLRGGIPFINLINIFISYSFYGKVMEAQLEQKVKGLVGKFHLLRTKEGSEEFDRMWRELKSGMTPEQLREMGKLIMQEMKNARERRKRTDVDVRHAMGDLYELVSLSYIAQHYFQKDRSWLAQRINGNVVNGKPSAFTDDELEILKLALTDIKNKLSETILNIK